MPHAGLDAIAPSTVCASRLRSADDDGSEPSMYDLRIGNRDEPQVAIEYVGSPEVASGSECSRTLAPPHHDADADDPHAPH